MNVLIVDDDADNREALEAWLRSLGYEVTIATSVDNALEQIARERERIGVAILDVELGRQRLGGLVVAAEVPPHVPVFYLSGRPREEVLAEARGTNAMNRASFWFSKPLDEDKLRELEGVLASLTRTRPTEAP